MNVRMLVASLGVIGVLTTGAQFAAASDDLEVTAINIKAKVINTSLTDVYLPITMQVQGDLEAACLELTNASTAQTMTWCYEADDEPLRSLGGGRYFVRHRMIRGIDPGKWELTRIVAQDFNDDAIVLTGDEIAAAGLQSSIFQTGAGDQEDPSIDNIATSTPFVSPGETVEFYLTMSDDVAGVNYFSLQLTQAGASFGTVDYARPYRIEGTSLSGTYRVQFEVPADTPAGTYELSFTQVFDGLTNHRTQDFSGIIGTSVTVQD